MQEPIYQPKRGAINLLTLAKPLAMHFDVSAVQDVTIDNE